MLIERSKMALVCSKKTFLIAIAACTAIAQTKKPNFSPEKECEIILFAALKNCQSHHFYS